MLFKVKNNIGRYKLHLESNMKDIHVIKMDWIGKSLFQMKTWDRPENLMYHDFYYCYLVICLCTNTCIKSRREDRLSQERSGIFARSQLC